MLTDDEIQRYDRLMKSRMTEEEFHYRPVIQNLLSDFNAEIQYLYNHRLLQILLSIEKLFQKLIRRSVLKDDNLDTLFRLIQHPPSHYERLALCKNTVLFVYSLEKGVLDEEIFFKNLRAHGLLFFLMNKDLLRALKGRKLLTEHLLENILLNTTDILEHQELCEDEILLNAFFDFNLCTSERYDEFNTRYHNNSAYSVRPNAVVFSNDFFEFIELVQKDKENLLKKSRICEALVHMTHLDEQEKNELKSMAKNHQSSYNNLLQLYKSDLHSQYNFKELKELITKDMHKKKFRLNF